jgi:tetratricopeptide (TPR) repeat protein
VTFRKRPSGRVSIVGSSGSVPEPLRRLLAAIALALAPGLAAATPDGPSEAWQGYLEVRAQAGLGCVPHSLPYRLRLEAVGSASNAPGLLVWGRMQTAQVLPGPGGRSTLRMLGASRASGTVALSPVPGGLAGVLREEGGPAAAGCSFTEAQLQLEPVNDGVRQQALQDFSAFLRELYAAQAALQSATKGTGARAPAAALLALAQRVPPAGPADGSVAQVFVDAAEQLQAMRERAAALGLAQAASSIYRRSVADHPDFAALALALEARLVYRGGGLAAAQPLLAEATAILGAHQRQASAAATSVFSQQGAWQLRAGDLQAAIASFGRAVRSDEGRQASALDRAASMSNLGTALQEAGDKDAALTLFRHALQLAESAPEGGASLVEVIRQHIVSLTEQHQHTLIRLV